MDTLRCPQCDSPNVAQVDANRYECPYCGRSFNTQEGMLAAQQAAKPMASTTKKSSSKTTTLIIVILLFVALLGGGWYAYQSYQEKHNAFDEFEVVDTVEVDTVEIDETFMPVRTQQGISMNLWGSIGDSEEVEFYMDGSEGWYSYSRQGTESSKRNLQFESYDEDTGECVLNAYLGENYIGCFKGIFESDNVDIGNGEWKTIQTYKGVFESVKGIKLDFNLYAD